MYNKYTIFMFRGNTWYCHTKRSFGINYLLEGYIHLIVYSLSCFGRVGISKDWTCAFFTSPIRLFCEYVHVYICNCGDLQWSDTSLPNPTASVEMNLLIREAPLSPL